MPYVDITDSISCKQTDVARNYSARSDLGELSFHLIGFSVGRYGYQDANPVKIIVVNPADTTLTDQMYPAGSGSTAFTQIETPLLGVIAPVCRVPRIECPYGLGELGIWAQIDFCVSPPPNAGDIFLYALAHMPLNAHAQNQMVQVFRVLLTT